MLKNRISNVIASFFIITISFALTTYPITKNLKINLKSYYKNDQRIYWSGLESTFLNEGNINIKFSDKIGKFTVETDGEFFLNQPYGNNILTDDVRSDYLPSFKINTFEISKLYIAFKKKNLSLKFGKFKTPFGKANYQLFLNNHNIFSPFIRSEAILWRETGISLNYRAGFLSFDIAIVNGEEEGDTNSSKAGILRIGLESSKVKMGISVKAQDGIGSEDQKEYKNHVGIDFFVKIHRKIYIYGEAIYDQYGFHRQIDYEKIYWDISYYYRDIFYKYKTPIEGIGGYFGLHYSSNSSMFDLIYGEYYPQKIGNPYHDEPVKRAIIKYSYKIKNLLIFSSLLFENKRPCESWRCGEKGLAFLIGIDFGYETGD